MPVKVNAGAIIPAAGLSSRFGGEPKALARFEGRSLLNLAVDAFRLCGLDNILVVTGHRRTEVEKEAADLGVGTVFNPDYREGMLSSIKTGLKKLQDGEAFYILPVDGALVKARSVLSLLSVWQQYAAVKKTPILVPVFGSRPGHPPLIPLHFKDDILNWSSPWGLRGWLASHLDHGRDDFLHSGVPPMEAGSSVIRFIRLEDEGIICDLDAPGDLTAAKPALRSELPRISEAWQLLLQSPLSQAKIRHHQKVAASALRLTLALKTAGEKQADPKLSLLGGLLHDLARDHDNHALAGRLRLESIGWPELALVVGAHTDPPAVFLNGLAIGLGMEETRQTDPAYAEASRRVRLSSLAVYLADKYWWDDEAVGIRQRFDITRRHKLRRADYSRHCPAETDGKSPKARRRIAQVWAQNNGAPMAETETRPGGSKQNAAKAITRRESVALGVEYWFRRVLAQDPETVARERSGDDGESDLEILYRSSFGRQRNKKNT